MFEQVYLKEVNTIRNYIYTKCPRGTINVEDIVQDVFISLYNSFTKLKSHNSDAVHRWLIVAAKRKIVDTLFRCPMPYREVNKVYIDDDELGLSARNEISSMIAEDQYVSELGIEPIINLLPHQYRDIFTWFYIDEVPIKEIAQRINTTPNTIKVRLCNIRAKLRNEYGDYLKNLYAYET